MKRIILALSALCAFNIPALAINPGYGAISAPSLGGPTTPTAEQFQSTMTILGLKISSQTTQATELTQYFETGDMLWRTLWVEDNDFSNAIYCSESPSVCKVDGTSCAGWRIPEISSKTYSQDFTLVPGQRLYCVCASNTAGCNAAIIRGR